MVAAARRVMDDHGFGMASVRFICGTQAIHKQLEGKISESSPVGRALMGHKVGDEVDVETQAGVVKLTISKVV